MINLDTEKNQNRFIELLKNKVGSEFVTIGETYSIYGPLKWINVYVSSEIPTDRFVLCGKDRLGRDRYEIITIDWRPNSHYKEFIRVCGRRPLLLGELYKDFEWDNVEKFESFGYPCMRKTINEEKMVEIIEYIKELLTKRIDQI